MTLLWMDGFDHLINGTQFVDKGYNSNLASAYLKTDYARFSGKGIKLIAHGFYFVKNFGADKSTIYMGIAFKMADTVYPGYSSGEPLISFYDESSVYQVKIHANSGFGFSAYDGGNTSLGSTSNNIWKPWRWYYIEVKVTISATVGEVTMKLNETQVLNLTSKDTKYGSDYIRSIKINGMYNGRDTWWDDFYIDDAQFHGDCQVNIFMPDADGNSSDFTRSTGSNDYECVDEVDANEDTDYISSNTLNHKSIFGITTGSRGTVKGVQVNNHCRIDDAGTRKITPIIRSNSTDYSGTETEAITSDYLWESEIFETDPDDSNVWTQTKLEAAEFGLEITT